ncbi:hypothetical protein RFI_15266 [Reticulomyxa filosa]|uniref:Uncharacterized protein n=1 Tax=Reticulomyxa filosa TaxID=46433 RepID=X6N9G6_RETFI|nr:hypothetical protein RFI_15266 [Reticulomyxa filosa]|eukprot:ETO21937.1 hypothetical protein RFI_15266 [Reticulomyxa filosa]
MIIMIMIIMIKKKKKKKTKKASLDRLDVLTRLGDGISGDNIGFEEEQTVMEIRSETTRQSVGEMISRTVKCLITILKPSNENIDINTKEKKKMRKPGPRQRRQ